MKLAEFSPEGERLLTVLCTDAVLDGDVLTVRLSDEDEVCTSSKERKNHFAQVDAEWFKKALSTEGGPATPIATPDHPLEILTADVSPILVFPNGKELLLSFFRDIEPVGWLAPGGCPRNLLEILDPQALAVREAAEEILLGTLQGDVFLVPAGLENPWEVWGLKPRIFIMLSVSTGAAATATASKLLVEWQSQRHETAGSFTIDPSIGSLALTVYWRIRVPVSLSELRIWDGERLPTGPLNRPARLTDQTGNVVAIFSGGHNILSASWITEEAGRRATARHR